MTGRKSSTVAAYLLKKQGYDCVGISFVFNKKEMIPVEHLDVDENLEGERREEALKKAKLEKKRIANCQAQQRFRWRIYDCFASYLDPSW